MKSCLYLFLLPLFFFQSTLAVELTFELPDNSKECFYENIDHNVSSILEYQVVTGGQYDVDVVIEGPEGVVYSQQKSQYDSFPFTPKTGGVYVVCFSNEFSTFAHKTVYMDFQVGEEKPLQTAGEHITVMTMMETSTVEIHRKLNTINDFQTHHRLRETTSRKRAETLNSTVYYFCLAETGLIFFTMIGLVFTVRSLFNDNKSTKRYNQFR